MNAVTARSPSHPTMQSMMLRGPPSTWRVKGVSRVIIQDSESTNLGSVFVEDVSSKLTFSGDIGISVSYLPCSASFVFVANPLLLQTSSELKTKDLKISWFEAIV